MFEVSKMLLFLLLVEPAACWGREKVYLIKIVYKQVSVANITQVFVKEKEQSNCNHSS